MTLEQSVFELRLYHADGFLRAVLEATTPREVAALKCVARLIRHLRAADVTAGVRCLCCEEAFYAAQLPQTVVVLAPTREDADVALALGLCRTCCTRFGSRLRAAILDALRATLDPNIREISVSATVGHA